MGSFYNLEIYTNCCSQFDVFYCDAFSEGYYDNQGVGGVQSVNHSLHYGVTGAQVPGVGNHQGSHTVFNREVVLFVHRYYELFIVYFQPR